MDNTEQARYFVTIWARSADDLRRLQAHGMDLFNATARRVTGAAATRSRSASSGRARGAAAASPVAIDGLLNRAEIAKLEAAGYQVKIDAPMADRTVKPGDTLEFDAWRDRMREQMAKDGIVK